MSKRKMRYISQGSLSKERLELLLMKVKVKNENTRSALVDYLVHGHPLNEACKLSDLKSVTNFERDIDRLNDLAEWVVTIEEYDWQRFNDKLIALKNEGVEPPQKKVK